MGEALHESSVPRPERLRRVGRLADPKTWRSLLLGVTDPANDPHWTFLRKRGTSRYLEQPEPWLAPGTAQLITEQAPNGRVFEWGAGSSTLWFVENGYTVTAYETHPDWARNVKARANGSAHVESVTVDDRYSTPDLGGYQIVLIDGRQRNACGLHTARTADPGTLVVFDDAHRTSYQDATAELSARAQWQRHLPGLSAMLTPKLTSVFRL